KHSTGPQAGGCSRACCGNLFRLARDLRREQPEKSSFLSVRIEVDQRHTGFGQFERSTSQRGDHTRKVRFVANQHQSLWMVPLEHSPQLGNPKSRLERFVLA